MGRMIESTARRAIHRKSPIRIQFDRQRMLVLTHQSQNLRRRGMLQEPNIPIHSLPSMRVIDRVIMINRILRSSTIPKVRTGHPKPLQERRVVRSRSKRANPSRTFKHRFKVVCHSEALGFGIVGLPISAVVHLEERAGRVVGVIDLVGGAAKEPSKRRGGRSVEVGSGGGDIDIEVGDDVSLQEVAKVFGELGGGDQAVLNRSQTVSADILGMDQFQLTSSASQLAIRMDRKGFHPFSVKV